MKLSSASRVPVLLALIAGCFVAEGTQHRVTVKSYKTNYRVDWYDDGRSNPYRITFWKFGLKSVYKFDESGNLRVLTAGDDRFKFDENVGSRKLTAPQDADVEEVHSSRRRLYDCTDCEETWDTLCDVGLADACYLDDNNPDYFTEDAVDSVRRMCSAFGAACETAAPEACDGQCTETEEDPEPTPAPIPEPTPAPVPEPTPAPVPEPTPAPTDATPEDACSDDPCENGGECTIDPAGGHLCSCAGDYGGMTCQTDTTSLDPFYIELDFIGTWTAARQAVFQTAADRWSDLITHVPCGGNDQYPAGRLLISSTLAEIDGEGGTLGSAGATNVWSSCPSISLLGAMTFDIDDIANMEENGTFEGVILHEMGHVIGVGTLWGVGFGACTTCREDSNPAWTCPATLGVYYDIGGSDADIVELDGGSGTSCAHLDEGIFDDELMTGYVDSIMYLSKMTAAILDDLDYVVDASAVDSYTLPSLRQSTISLEEPLFAINDTAVDAIIFAMSDEGEVVDELDGVIMKF